MTNYGLSLKRLVLSCKYTMDIYLFKLNKPAIRDFIFRTQQADSNYSVDGVKLFM